ncbi:hypothetical protein C1H76_2920 [Elsinoe australis]|uniref:Uncharacterized protein n=1 Tax=Elsinoe australis TaxID=40998 RepID=A0A4U7B4U9_9PEZI|nr:hypothetical protein C1H76_2920 [Elsinoe australis]
MQAVWLMLVWLQSVWAANTTINATTSANDSTIEGPLHRYCSSLIQDFFKTYVATEIATTLVPGYEGFGPTDSNGVSTGPITSRTAWTSTYLYTQFPIRAYTAKPPCCSSCYFSVGTMRLLYWPDQASATVPPSGAVSTFVNTNSFTLTSPSVYMIFTSIQAKNMCGQVGDVWTNKTIGFHPDEISTINPYVSVTLTITTTVSGKLVTTTSESFTQAPAGPIDYAQVAGNCSSVEGYTYWPDQPFNAGLGAYTLDPCHPILQIPTALVSAQPAWASARCTASPGAGGIYDPPITLDSANSFMVPTFTSAAIHAQTAQSLQVGSSSTYAPPMTAEATVTTRQPSQTGRSTSMASSSSVPSASGGATNAASVSTYSLGLVIPAVLRWLLAVIR